MPEILGVEAPIVASATIQNDINFTLIKLGSNNQNESAKLNYSRSFTHGSGALQINHAVVTSGVLASGGQDRFNLQSMNKFVFGTTNTISFSDIKSIVVENNETGYGQDIAIRATGANSITELFNGGTGNIVIKPYSVYQYSDPISGATVDASNREFTIADVGGSGSQYTIIVVGVTG